MESKSSNGVSKRATLLVATLGSFLVPFMASSINIALPSIGREFASDAVTLSWIASSYLLAAAVFLVPFGRIADIYGRKKVFIYGVFTYLTSAVLAAVAPSDLLLVAFRGLEGIGAAMIFGTGVAILTSVFPAEERGKVLGINIASTYTGLSLGPPVGGFLTGFFGWRSVFLLNVPLSLLIIAAVFWKLKGEWAGARGEKFDFTGSIIYSVALVAVMYGFSVLPAISAVWFLVIGILGILAFIWWEMRVKSPVLNIGLFKNNTVFVFSNLAALINYSATFIVGFLLSLYLQYIKGFDPEHAGLILVSQPVFMAALSPIAGRLSDRLEPRVVSSIGMALTTLGLASFIFLGNDTRLAFIIGGLVILGIGFAFFSSPNTNAVMSSVEKKYYGVAAGTLGTMRLIGQMLSIGIAMLLFALYIGRVEILPEYYPFFLQSVRTAFTISAIICFGGIFASLARGKLR